MVTIGEAILWGLVGHQLHLCDEAHEYFALAVSVIGSRNRNGFGLVRASNDHRDNFILTQLERGQWTQDAMFENCLK